MRKLKNKNWLQKTVRIPADRMSSYSKQKLILPSSGHRRQNSDELDNKQNK